MRDLIIRAWGVYEGYLGATCNIVSDKDAAALSDRIHVTESLCVPEKSGDESLKPMQIELISERDLQFHTLDRSF